MNSPIIGGKLGSSRGSVGEPKSQKLASAMFDVATSEIAIDFAQFINQIY